MEQRRRIAVDGGACVGSRMCQMAAPGLFRIDAASGKAVAVEPLVDDGDALWDAAEGCPNEAIMVEDEDSGRRLFP